MKKVLPLIIFITLLLSGCAYKEANTYVEKTDFLLDTVVTVRLYDGDESRLEGCFDIIKKYDAMFSSTDPDSEVSKINSSDGTPVTVSDETADLISIAKDYGKLSEGRFDLTIGKVTSLWDFHSETPALPTDSDINQAIKTIDYNLVTIDGNNITLSPSASGAYPAIDLGGIAKGYITDRIRDYLISEGVTSASISLGGNVYLLGKRPDGSSFVAGIQKPFAEDSTPACTLKVTNKSVVTSGIYQRYFEIDGKRYHHLLDTNTGYPIENDLYSVTIISDNSTDGDALSTMVFAMGLEDGMAYVESRPDIDAIFIDNKNGIHATSGMDAYDLQEY